MNIDKNTEVLHNLLLSQLLHLLNDDGLVLIGLLLDLLSSTLALPGPCCQINDIVFKAITESLRRGSIGSALTTAVGQKRQWCHGRDVVMYFNWRLGRYARTDSLCWVAVEGKEAGWLLKCSLVCSLGKNRLG